MLYTKAQDGFRMMDPFPRQVAVLGFFGGTHVLAEWGRTLAPPNSPSWLLQSIALIALIALAVVSLQIVWDEIPLILRGGIRGHRNISKFLKELQRRIHRATSVLLHGR